MRKTSKDRYEEIHKENTAKTDKLVEGFTPTEEGKQWFSVVTGLFDVLIANDDEEGKS